ncbi:hypothetical protein K0U83_04180 [bacterium]|nr:hypothetical protein [bacterium]
MKDSGGDDRSATGGICGARTRSGGICQKPGLENGRCRNHGGKSLKGVATPSFRTGRYSKALRRLDDDFSDRVNDPRLLDPRRSMAVQEAAMARLAEILEQADSPEFRLTAKAMLRDALEALKEDPVEGLGQLRALRGYIERGVEESRALVGMKEAADTLNKAQIRYWQVAMSASRAISPEEFMALMFRMADIIETEVDNDAARRILERTDAEVCGGSLGLSGSD